MSNEMLIGYPSFTNKYNFAGGDWQTNYPASNAANLIYAKVARSSDLLPSSTQLVLTSLDPRPVRLIGFFSHNMDLDAAFRIRLYDSSTTPETLLYDSGLQQVWDIVYSTQDRAFESENWFTGQYSDDERAGQIPSRPFVIPDGFAPDKIIIEFFNQLNNAGFIDIGLVEVAGAIELATYEQPQWGANWGYESQSSIAQYDGGLIQSQIYAPSYVFQGEIPYLANDKARQTISELFRQYGEHKPFMWLANSEDAINYLRQCKMVRNKQAGLLTYATNSHMAIPINLIEWMG